MTVLALSGLSTDAASACDRCCTPESIARDRHVKSASVGLLLSSFVGTEETNARKSLLGSR
jgi:hypothetical protein